jgi:hypothetical protein
MVKKDCCLVEKQDEEFPCPAPKRTGCFPDEEFQELPKKALHPAPPLQPEPTLVQELPAPALPLLELVPLLLEQQDLA